MISATLSTCFLTYGDVNKLWYEQLLEVCVLGIGYGYSKDVELG